MASSERTGLTEGQNARQTAVSRIEALDTSVFAIQPGHYSDRTSFLRVQRLVRTLQPGYAYLEVGSDLGGSLLPHLLDPACRVAVSVDPRPQSQPDERGSDFHYVGNSTARMLAELGKHANAEELGKLVTLDTDAAAIDRTVVATRPRLVLIDAEHTNVAAFSDFLSILPLVADDSIITFHDANLVGDAIQIIERFLAFMRTPYSMVILPSCVAVFGFGAFLKPVQTELAPHAEESQHYFATARQQRQEAVADAVIARTVGLPSRGIAELVAWAANTQQTAASAAASLASMQDRLDAFTNSTSWRLTAPLRAAALLARRHRKP
jgi:methyltransferase family protein